MSDGLCSPQVGEWNHDWDTWAAVRENVIQCVWMKKISKLKSDIHQVANPLRPSSVWSCKSSTTSTRALDRRDKKKKESSRRCISEPPHSIPELLMWLRVTWAERESLNAGQMWSAAPYLAPFLCQTLVALTPIPLTVPPPGEENQSLQNSRCACLIGKRAQTQARRNALE